MADALAAAVRSHWCARVDPCGGRFGLWLPGSLTGQNHLKTHNLSLTSPNIEWQPSGQRCWRFVLPSVLDGLRDAGTWIQPRPHRIFSFGVFEGASMYLYRHWWPDAHIVGFDSFEGLPAEKRGEVRRAAWNKGAFRVKATVHDRILRDLNPRTRLVRGFFKSSLTPELARTLAPATIVDIDSDLYVSAYEVLDWLFTHRLARAGTLVAYDDWSDHTCTPILTRSQQRTLGRGVVSDGMVWGVDTPTARKPTPTALYKAVRESAAAGRFPRLFEAGEPKAHAEIARKHRVRFRCLAGACKARARAAPRTPGGASTLTHTKGGGGRCRPWCGSDDGDGRRDGGGHRGGDGRRDGDGTGARSSCDPHAAFGAVFVVTAVDDGRPGDNGVEMVDGDELTRFRQEDAACAWVGRKRFSTNWTDAPTM